MSDRGDASIVLALVDGKVDRKRRTALWKPSASGEATNAADGDDGFPLELDWYAARRPGEPTTLPQQDDNVGIGRAGAKQAEIPKALGFDDRIAAVRAGKPGFVSSERTALRRQLEDLNDAQRGALRRALLANAQDVGSAPEDLMPLLEGAHRGLTAEVDDAMRAAVAQLSGDGFDLDRLDDEQRTVLHRGQAALDVVRRYGWPGVHALTTFGYETVETMLVVSPRALEWLVHGGRSHDEQLQTAVETFGARYVANAIDGLLDRELGIANTFDKLGFDRAMVIGHVLHDRQPAERAYKALHGGWDAFWELLSTIPLHELEEVLDFYEDRVDSYGSNEAALLAGGYWPSLTPERTPDIRDAERRILAELSLPPDALDDPSRLGMNDASRLSEALERHVAERSNIEGDRMRRELRGRRFISFTYYDELYERGVVNPEHRYSKETFRSWCAADDRMRALAEETGGRPLRPGEFTDVMKELHRIAGEGLTKTGQTWQQKSDLGRLRSRPMLDRTGIYAKNVDDAKMRKVRDNPYLAVRVPFWHYIPGLEGTRYIEFSGAWRSRFHVAGLDEFVRNNEAVLSPEELAAEVHHRIVSIHPFLDGNGRTAKLMVDFLLLRQGIQPIVWNEGDVLLNRDRWAQVVENGARNRLAVAHRYFCAVTDAA